MPSARSEGRFGAAAKAIDIAELRTQVPVRRIRGRNLSKADILVYRLHGVELALKDYSARPFLVRQTVGRFLTSRECAAYRAAGDLPGLPGFLGRCGPFALATRWIEARPLAGLDPAEIPADCFDRLRRILDGLHLRGVALADLHHRDVLVAGDGSVHVVDLAAAWIAGPHVGPVRRFIFARLRDQDDVALLRMRARWSGADPDAAVRALGGAAAAWHRRGRGLKRLLMRLRGSRD